MFPIIKSLSLVSILVSGLFTSTITSPFTTMFGKQYNITKDFTCCRKDQLVVHHFFSLNLFWIKVGEGYTEENLGKAEAGQCNIRCTY